MCDQGVDPLIDQGIDDSTQPCPQDLTFCKNLRMDLLYYKFYKGYTRDDYKDDPNLGKPLGMSFKFIREEQGIKIYHSFLDNRSKTSRPNSNSFEFYIDYSPPVLVDKKHWDRSSSCIGQIYWRYLNDVKHHPEILFRIWYRWDEEDYNEDTQSYQFNQSCLYYNCWYERSLQGQIAFKLLRFLNIEIGEYELESFSLDEYEIYLHMENIHVDIPKEAIDRQNRAIEEQQKIWQPILENWKNNYDK